DIDGSKNAYHVVVSVREVGAALLDGFTISGGKAEPPTNGNGDVEVNGMSINRRFGGGIYNYRSSPSLINVVLSGNSADEGGGVYNNGSSSFLLTLTNVVLSGNSAGNGGGVYNGSFSSLSLTNVVLSG